MADRVNRRDLILETASRLFLDNGYAETSVRQIAEAAQVTEAALYYHFKGGKYELFQHAMDDIAPDFTRVIEACERAQSLRELVLQFGLAMMPNLPTSGVLMRWVAIQVQSATGDEYNVVLDRLQWCHEQLAAQVERFVPDATKAQQMAWSLLVMSIGYGYIFGAVRMSERSDFSPQDLLDLVLGIVDQSERG